MHQPKKKRTYKISKSKEPDVGTYFMENNCLDQVTPRIQAAFIGRPKEKGVVVTDSLTFTKQSVRLKKFVPGVGSY